MEQETKVEGTPGEVSIFIPPQAKAERPKAPSKTEMAEARKANGHGEAACIAFADWMIEGQKWGVTFRAGATKERFDQEAALAFTEALSKVSEGMVALGCVPCDRNARVEFPPRSEEERIAALAEEKAKEIAAEHALNAGKMAALNYAIRRGIVKGKDDKAGVDRLLATAEAAGLKRDTCLSKLADWIDVVDGLALEAQHRAAQPQAQAAPPPPPAQATAGAPPPPPTPPPAPPTTTAQVPGQPQGDRLYDEFVRFEVVTWKGKPRVQFWSGSATLKYPVNTYDLGADRLLACSPVMVQKGWTLAHLVPGASYAVPGRAYYVLSSKKKSTGEPYRDITEVMLHG